MRLTLIALFALVQVSCSNRKAVEKAESLADQACNCSGLECTERVSEEFAQSFMEDTPRGSREDSEKIAAAYQRLTECQAEIAKTEKP